MKKAFLLSITFHLLLLISMKNCGGKGGGYGDDRQIEQKDKTITVVRLGDLHYLNPVKKKRKEPKCKDYYGGIGTTYLFSDNLPDGGMKLIDVPEGYPAYEAGIRSGDVIRSKEEITGKVGTEVQITVTHKDGKVESLVLIRAKICIGKPKRR